MQNQRQFDIDDPRIPKKILTWKDRLKSFKLWITIFSVAVSIMGLVGFAEFMYEEAGQQAGFACFILKTGGLANDAYAAATRYLGMLQSMDHFVTRIGWLSPLNWHAYKMWIKGARMDAQAVLQWAISQNPVLAQSVNEAQVVSVIDGDSLVLSTGEEIRLAGIDAAEWYEADGPAAKQFLASLLLGKLVRITRYEQGYYGRVIADLSYNGQDAGAAMVKAGLARIVDQAKLPEIDGQEGTTTTIEAQRTISGGYLLLTGSPCDVFITDATDYADTDWTGQVVTVKGKVKLYNGSPEVVVDQPDMIQKAGE